MEFEENFFHLDRVHQICFTETQNTERVAQQKLG